MEINTFYINGEWVKPHTPKHMQLINPTDETVIGQLSLGNKNDVDHAVHAAREAFTSYSTTSVDFRISLLENILRIYKEKYDEFAELMRIEMGSPISFAKNGQAMRGVVHLEAAIHALKHFEFTQTTDTGFICHEPIGVCGLITPWNWPINQIIVNCTGISNRLHHGA